MDTPTRSRMALSANISNTASHLAGKKNGSRWSPLPMTNATEYLLCSSLSLLLSCERSIHEWQSFPAERRRREASLPRLCIPHHVRFFTLSTTYSAPIHISMHLHGATLVCAYTDPHNCYHHDHKPFIIYYIHRTTQQASKRLC